MNYSSGSTSHLQNYNGCWWFTHQRHIVYHTSRSMAVYYLLPRINMTPPNQWLPMIYSPRTKHHTSRSTVVNDLLPQVKHHTSRSNGCQWFTTPGQTSHLLINRCQWFITPGQTSHQRLQWFITPGKTSPPNQCLSKIYSPGTNITPPNPRLSMIYSPGLHHIARTMATDDLPHLVKHTSMSMATDDLLSPLVMHHTLRSH